MKFFHGTTETFAKNILENGFRSERPTLTTWKVSDYGCLYVISAAEEDPIRFAIDAGRITAAKFGEQNRNIYVFEFDIQDKEVANSALNEDLSCRNMYHCFTLNSDNLDELIASGEIKMTYTVYDAYKPMFRPFYLAGVSLEYMQFSEEDKELLEAIKIAQDINNGGYISEYDDFDTPYEIENDCDWGEEDLEL